MSGIFSYLFGTKPAAPAQSKLKESPKANVKVELEPKLLDSDRKDYLGMAAKNKHAAKSAIKAKEFDTAWKLLHEQKHNYMAHAQVMRFDKAQTLSLDGTVHEDLANILRLEKKHKDALVHIVYWAVSGTSLTKSHISKLTAYFNRCKFEETCLSSLIEYYESNIENSIEFLEVKGLIQTFT